MPLQNEVYVQTHTALSMVQDAGYWDQGQTEVSHRIMALQDEVCVYPHTVPSSLGQQLRQPEGASQPLADHDCPPGCHHPALGPHPGCNPSYTGERQWLGCTATPGYCGPPLAAQCKEVGIPPQLDRRNAGRTPRVANGVQRRLERVSTLRWTEAMTESIP